MTTDNTALEQYRNGSLADRHEFARALSTAGDLIPTALHAFPVGENGQRVPGQSQPSPGKVLLVLETGAMLGLPPVAALQGIQVIEGKATLSAGMMSAVVRRAGHHLRVTETGTVEGGDLSVTATLVRRDDPDNPFTATWTPHKAARAGLCTYRQQDGVWQVIASGQRGPKPWQAYTEAMCRNRAISEVCRMGAEDALYGVHYTPEEAVEARELGDDVTVASEPQTQEAARKRVRRAPAKGKQGTKRETAEPTPTPEQEEVVEAEVVEHEEPTPEAPADDVPMYAAEVAEPQAPEAEEVPPADGPTDDGEVPPEDEAYDLQPPEYVHEATGTIYHSQEELDAAASAPAPTEGGQPDWTERLKAAKTVADVKAVWDATANTPALTTELRLAIIDRKAALEAQAK